MSVIDTLFHIFEGSQPENGTAENKKKAQAVYDANKDHIQGVLGSLVPPSQGDLTVNPDVESPATPPANAEPSSFDVNGSDTTATANGAVETPQISDSLMSSAPSRIGYGDQTPPAAPAVPPITDQPALNTPATAPVALPTTAPSTPPQVEKPGMSEPASPDIASVLSNPNSSDNDKRNAMLEGIKRKEKLGLIPNALGGIADAIGNAAKPFGGQGASGTQNDVIAEEEALANKEKTDFESKLKNDPNSETSKAYRQMVLQMAPELAKNADFNQMSAQSIGDKLPLIDTMMKAKASEDARKASLAQTAATKDLNIGLRRDQQQDKLEQAAKMGVQNLRGDKSLARAEEQRDAAIVAYNRLSEVEKSGKGLNPIDYTDILGQIYKARTGAAPGEQVLQQIRQLTAKGQLDKAYTYMTGQQAPATTQGITSSLKNMAQSMGQQADKFHDGYMKAHLIKPKGLDDDRWEPIASTGRGISFAEATGLNNPTTQSSQSSGKRTSPSGYSYTVSQ